MPYTLTQAVTSELVIKKSRFIGCVQPVQGRTQALDVVASLRAAHPGAAHVCWALMAGGQSAAVDDGEPSGTAGRPMLDVLRHQDLEGVLATVVRYYGGVKLGAGGLVRAYTDSVAQALLNAERVAIVRKKQLGCEIPYAFEGAVRRLLAEARAELGPVEHDHAVCLNFTLAIDAVPDVVLRVNEITQGRVVWCDDTDDSPDD